MIFPKAQSDWEDLQRRGLRPTFGDAVALNAIGLRWQAAKGKAPNNSLDYLPRVAAISENVSFRQPTVGHEIWLDRVERLVAEDFETLLAVKAFALSRPPDQLPDADDPKSVAAAVEAFAATCGAFTHEQILAALDYVCRGASPVEGVYPPRARRADEDAEAEPEPDGSEDQDWKECIALGVLHEGRAVLWGINQREMESMTRRQLEELVRRAYFFHKLETRDPAEYWREGYYRKLDEIAERLEKERQDGQQ